MTTSQNSPQQLAWGYKEWWGIVHYMLQGKQMVLIRKGGLEEPDGGFSVEHPNFWFFPTYYHQAADRLSPQLHHWLDSVETPDAPETGTLHLPGWAHVTDVLRITDKRQLPGLAQYHGWSDDELDRRFDYRRPGLFLLIVRAYSIATPHELVETPHFAGCKSWVDFPSELSTQPCEAVLDDATFAQQRQEIIELIGPIATA